MANREIFTNYQLLIVTFFVHFLRLRENFLVWSSMQKKGIDGLNNRPPSGRPKIKGCVVEEEVEVMLAKTPRDFGYREEGWTVRIILDFFQSTKRMVQTAR